MQLLTGECKDEELVVSLKSVVPVLIAYPEIIIPFKGRLSDVVPYYIKDEDYNDISRNIILENGKSPTQLIVLFTKIFEMVVKLFNSGDSSLEYMPRVKLKVDIGSSVSQFEVISPAAEQVAQFDSSKAKMFTFTGFNATEDSVALSYEQKHNLLLVDILMRKYNNSGVGGRS